MPINTTKEKDPSLSDWLTFPSFPIFKCTLNIFPPPPSFPFNMSWFFFSGEGALSPFFCYFADLSLHPQHRFRGIFFSSGFLAAGITIATFWCLKETNGSTLSFLGAMSKVSV